MDFRRLTAGLAMAAVLAGSAAAHAPPQPGGPQSQPVPAAQAVQADIDACYVAAGEDDAKLDACDVLANAFTAVISHSSPEIDDETKPAAGGPMDPEGPAIRAEMATCARQDSGYPECFDAPGLNEEPDRGRWPEPYYTALAAHGGRTVERGELSRLARRSQQLSELLTTDQYVGQPFAGPPVADPWPRADMRGGSVYDVFNCVQIVLPRRPGSGLFGREAPSGYYRLTGVLVREPLVDLHGSVGSRGEQLCVRNGQVYFYVSAMTPIVRPSAFAGPLQTDAEWIMLRWVGGNDAGTVSFWISPDPVGTDRVGLFDAQSIFTVSRGLYRQLQKELREQECSREPGIGSIEFGELANGRFHGCYGGADVLCGAYDVLMSVYIDDIRSKQPRLKRRQAAEAGLRELLRRC